MAKKIYKIVSLQLDEAAGQLIIDLEDTDSPIIPTGIRPDLWYPQRNGSVTLTLNLSSTLAAPIEKQVPVSIYMDENTNKLYRVRYKAGSWTEPVEVDSNGKVK